ncbi:SdiA-regulated domain-containing protein [Reichenbachiella sp. MALMAid0571]|uniref:SdiA-regulated domain-containing protein n=1 Tax=Reichenbachiella sp. MALMAid0571 TaxID=3143939 RepID=UPI0032E01C65
MRPVVLASFCMLLNFQAFTQDQFTELELISLSQLQKENSLRFDLSGIVVMNGKYYINADKEQDNFIYEIGFYSNKWHIKSKIPLNIEELLDLEAIDYCNGKFYLANEKNGNIYSKPISGKAITLPIDFNGEKPWEWKNAGWEGLANDCANNILYLVKERQPRKIFKVNLSSNKVVDTFNIPETESNDFADAKFENGFLYLLERNGNFVTKVNPDTHEVIQKVSYKQICSNKEGKLFAPSTFGMAESLLLTAEEIWIGLDNNGLEVSGYASKKYGIKGNGPVIIKFKRPEGF